MFRSRDRNAGGIPWRTLMLLGMGYYLYRSIKRDMLDSETLAAQEVEAQGSHAEDEVDQSSWESFPASDPPAWSGTRS